MNFKKILSLLLVVGLAAVIAACTKDNNNKNVPAPVLSGLTDEYIALNSDFDPKAGVTATDETDGDLTEDIVVTGSVDTSKQGSYTLTYKVTNKGGKTTTRTRSVVVAGLANGTFNFRYATPELRHSFFAAAEKYLLDTMNGGIPVYANSGFNLYSSRMQLPVDNYVPVMGFGTIFSTMAEDDSKVKMEDGSAGKAGEFTYRIAISNNPTTFQHWKYDDSASSDVLTYLLDSLYTFEFNQDKTGYDLNPSMASENPIAVGGKDVNGVELAKVWEIKIKDGLTWTYHPDTDTSSFPAGHEKMDANDFVETYKMSLEEGWFRAISGGGHFFGKSQEIVNAEKFYEEEATWDQVGIKATDANTIRFEFVNDMSEWNVKYWLSSWVMTPVNFALLEQAGDQYGTSPVTTAYHGPFVLDYFEADSVVRLSKNENFHAKDKYFFTGVNMQVIKESNLRFVAFQNDLVDAASLPTEFYDEYKDDIRLKKVPGVTTFRIMINGFGTKEELNKTFPETDYTPNPLLANVNFKRAMYFAIDRKALAEDILRVYEPQMYHFSNAYLVDAATGIPFRGTEEAKLVAEGRSSTSFGFNPDLAEAYFKAAVDELIDAGTYSEGTEASPTIININLRIFADSPAQVLFAEYIKDTFEETFQYEEKNVKVILSYTPTQFPNIYYDYMMKANFDLAIGGISGSTLDAASFLEVYNTDDRGGFTINWGFDTSIANILVKYVDPATDEEVTEFWSYDAIVSALNGTIDVENGREVE